MQVKSTATLLLLQCCCILTNEVVVKQHGKCVLTASSVSFLVLVGLSIVRVLQFIGVCVAALAVCGCDQGQPTSSAPTSSAPTTSAPTSSAPAAPASTPTASKRDYYPDFLADKWGLPVSDVAALLNKAKSGDAFAQFNMGYLFSCGLGPGDPVNKQAWGDLVMGRKIRPYTDKRPYTPTKVDYEMAKHWYHKAAEQGSAEAQYALGYYYMEGWPFQPGTKDVAEAIKWFKSAATNGYTKAGVFLGLWFYEGRFTKMDHAESKKWLTLAAEQGDKQAQHYLFELNWSRIKEK